MQAGGSTSKGSVAARGFLDFVNASTSPFHAVESAARLLKKAGYRQISEKSSEDWKSLGPNSKVFFTRNQSSLFALAFGGKSSPSSGFTIVGAHTDSPVLRVKPVSAISKHSFEQVGVELYGGGLWNTWFDRDLSLAGRVIVEKEDGQFESRLVDLKKPLLFIPSLAIHLNREIYDTGFKPNFETQTVPIISTSIKKQLEAKTAADSGNLSHNTLLLEAIAQELGVAASQVRDFELSLYDFQGAKIGGALDEFIFSGRLDNLMMSFCSIEALIQSDSSLADDSNVRIVALFDHEEVGSTSAHGADSNMLLSTLERVAKENVKESIRKSILISADMAHAIHPNYPEKHESNHRPEMHKGIVIKYNAKQRYATNSVTAFILKEIARRHSIPIQEFLVRNDSACGSTIGPMLSANVGIRTIDIGIAQLGMHSIREVCGVDDVEHSIRLLNATFSDFSKIDNSLQVEP